MATAVTAAWAMSGLLDFERRLLGTLNSPALIPGQALDPGLAEDPLQSGAAPGVCWHT